MLKLQDEITVFLNLTPRKNTEERGTILGQESKEILNKLGFHVKEMGFENWQWYDGNGIGVTLKKLGIEDHDGSWKNIKVSGDIWKPCQKNTKNRGRTRRFT
ncbi:hypothetical protein PRBEI_2000395700 [Prionailurus iriomotensis]